jgi:hypothetical protein
VIASDGASITATQARQLEAMTARCWDRKGRRALEIKVAILEDEMESGSHRARVQRL